MEPQSRIDDCYFCLVNITRNNRNKWTYLDLFYARLLVTYSEDVTIPTLHQLLENSEDEYCLSSHPSDTNESDSYYSYESYKSKDENYTELVNGILNNLKEL